MSGAAAPEDCIAALDSPRPDFNGALIQFLIGLVQTSGLAPEKEINWKHGLKSPPSPETLREAFSRHKEAFNLDGDTPRFLQDFAMEGGKTRPIRDLLIDISANDHFIKQKDGDGFCFACAAVALFCLQTNAPEGGRGHRTGLRGGGPLTSLILPPSEDLWTTLWLNLVSQDLNGGAGQDYPDDPRVVFPWLAPTRTSEEKTGASTSPEDAHPLQVYWSMPRRIRLDFADLGSGCCDVCGRPSKRLLQRYFTKPHGVHYQGYWRHPLTPYNALKTGGRAPTKARAHKVDYRNWIGLVLGSEVSGNEARTQHQPALVVETFCRTRRRAFGHGEPLWLWVFGYDMKKKRARCWFEGRLPMPALPEDRISEEHGKLSRRMMNAAAYIAGILRGAHIYVSFRPGETIERSVVFTTDVAFWSGSQSVFFEHIDALISELANTCPATTNETLKSWHKYLCRLSLKLFDEYVMAGPIEHQNVARIARARNKLRWLSNGKKMRIDILQLPETGGDPPTSVYRRRTR